MENAPRREAAEPVLARNHFHLILALIFIPYVSVAVGWVFGILNLLKKPATPLQTHWTRLLLVLAVADTLVLIGLSSVLANPDLARRSPGAFETPKIGVDFDAAAPKGELRVGEVHPGMPAARAGIEVGDVIERIDGTPVSSVKDFEDVISKEGVIKARTLVVRRGEITEELTVTPELPARPSRGLFEGRPSSEAIDWLGLLTQFLPAGGAGLLVWLVSLKRARTRVVVWRGVMIATAASAVASVGTGFLLKAILGGWSIGGALLALVAQMAALLAVTSLLEHLYARDSDDSRPPLPPVRAGLQGLFYLITGIPRVSVLLWMADRALFQGRGTPTNQLLDALAAASLGDLGTGLFVFAVVFLGPLAEESLFRGFLLPRLATQWGAGSALFVSSMIFALFHPHYGMYMPIVFLYGWVFGWARLRSGGIGASWFLHVAVNGVVSFIMLSK